MQTKKPAAFERRLTKVAVKRLVKARRERQAFFDKVQATKSTPEQAQKQGCLVQKVRAAKSAPFLGQYRRAPAG